MRTRTRLAGLLSIFLITAGLMACAAAAVRSPPGTETTIVMVRHAERTTISKVLTPKGHARARDLVEAVSGLGISAIYSPDLERNLDTVKPLARHLGLEITVTAANSTPLVAAIVDEMLDRHAGGTILWVGNVDNLRTMYWHLGGDGEGPIEYGDLFIFKIGDQGLSGISRTHFGM